MTSVPVRGEVLKWAREFRGLSEEAASERLGIPISDLRAYEANQKQPSVTLFEGFAAKYRLPQATLFLETPPAAPPPPKDFRTVGGRGSTEHSFEFGVALSNIRSWLFQAERVALDDEVFTPPRLPQIALDDDPAFEGERERRRLGVSIDEQLSWKSSEAFGHWRALAEKQGVLVFQQKFPIKDGRGFSLSESENNPSVIINKEESADVAKSFTLWHEYCHLLLRRPGISDQDPHNGIEAFCNRFAAALLIPRDGLRRLLPLWPNSPVEWSKSDIEVWARRLKVSRRALAIRLEQLQLAPSGYAKAFSLSYAAPPRQTSGGSYVATRLSELGSAFVGRIVDAYDREAIDAVQFSEATGLSSERIGDAREYTVRVRELAGVD